MIIQDLIIARLYTFYSKDKSTFSGAITCNLMMVLILFSVSTRANAAKIQVTYMPEWLLIQTGFHLLQFLAAGVIIGLVNRQK